MLLRTLDDVQPDFVCHIDHDEFLEPETANYFEAMVADAEADAWAMPRRNFIYDREHYSVEPRALRFRERVFYRWQPGLSHPTPEPDPDPEFPQAASRAYTTWNASRSAHRLACRTPSPELEPDQDAPDLDACITLPAQSAAQSALVSAHGRSDGGGLDGLQEAAGSV
jgi:hypothetical protein